MLLGVWPFVVRKISASLCGEKPVGLYLDRDRKVVRCSVSVAEADAVHGVVLFEVIATKNWERRVSEWLVDYWSCVVDDFVPVGDQLWLSLSCWRFAGRRRWSSWIATESCAIGFYYAIVTSAGSSVFDGQDVHVVMDFLLVKLRDCLTDPVLLSCPALLRFSEILYLVFN